MIPILIVSMTRGHGRFYSKVPSLPKKKQGIGYYKNGDYHIGIIFSIVYQFDEGNNFKYVEITVE